MFRKLKRRKSMMQKMMDMDMDVDVMSVVKIMAAGALLYGTAKYMWNELMD
ncbi:hypothetical protein [Thermosinus carboxydivorans]|uniref:hypothetical protein n=1 Tax=Thermosinus carboxydivorans TaxID=261685 RepID=UPI0003083A7E|nr:hypothetical protein [Thermosinus carboxydivorans]